LTQCFHSFARWHSFIAMWDLLGLFELVSRIGLRVGVVVRSNNVGQRASKSGFTRPMCSLVAWTNSAISMIHIQYRVVSSCLLDDIRDDLGVDSTSTICLSNPNPYPKVPIGVCPRCHRTTCCRMMRTLRLKNRREDSGTTPSRPGGLRYRRVVISVE
jgi:hypothetical protein